MDATLKKQLEITATKVRMGVIEGVYNAKSGHPGGSLSVADVLTYLYFAKMNVDPKNPQMPERDRLVLSKGHTAPALYSVLANRGFFPVEDLKTLRHIGSKLQGHPVMNKVPGVDMSTGSLGQGISAACGMALSGKLSNDFYKVYAIDGRISDVMSPYPIDEKFKAFGWHVISIDAHDFDAIEKAFAEAEKISGQPTVIIQRSIKGKGVSFMEDQVSWHGTAPNEEQYNQAMTELKAHLAELEK